MYKLVIKIALFVSIFGCVNAFAGEFCSADRINQTLDGKWKGTDSYYFSIRTSSTNKLCIEILEDETDTVRNIRDIIIIDGKLRHLTYFTPSTQAYVVYTNIKLEKDGFSFDWYSSYANKGGKDTYYKLKGNDKGSAFLNNLNKPDLFVK